MLGRRARRRLRRRRDPIRNVRFLFTAPLIVAFLFVVNLMTSPGEWWFLWAALGLGFVWFIKLFRVLRLIVVAGGLAALVAYVTNRQSS